MVKNKFVWNPRALAENAAGMEFQKGDFVMKWMDQWYEALNAAKMFEDSWHGTRFKELLDCYGSYPFFTKGLCKCMYLSAWDEEHFCIMLETLSALALGKEPDTKEMRIKGDALMEEQTNAEAYVYQLSNSFLDNAPFHLPEDADIDPGTRYIIERALEAAKLIDQFSF